MKKKKRLVLTTAMAAALFMSILGIQQAGRLPERIAIDTMGQPSVGTGEIELVVFEDFCCTNCRTFTEEIFPKIASEYVDTGRARLTVIPVAFGEKSKPLANAAIGVYKMAPDRFVPYILELLHSKAESREGMLKAAETVGGIDLKTLADCIDNHLYYKEIDQNLTWAKRLMGEEFGTPTLFVSGVMTSTASFDAVADRIRQVEQNK